MLSRPLSCLRLNEEGIALPAHIQISLEVQEILNPFPWPDNRVIRKSSREITCHKNRKPSLLKSGQNF